MHRDPFLSHGKIARISEKVLAASPADETELVWFERRHGLTSNQGRKQESLERPRLTVLVRVVDGKRMGWHRAETSDLNLLESGVRQALAISRVQSPVKRRPVMPTDTQPLPKQRLEDPRIAGLKPAKAGSLLERWCTPDTNGHLSWSQTRVSVFNNHGLHRQADTTEVSFRAICGAGEGAGVASASSRNFKYLAPETIVERARMRRSEGPPASFPKGPIPAFLAPEAVIELLHALNMLALSGRAYLDGSSFLTQHRGEQVFHRSLNLRDDGTNQLGMPFPFDLEGSPKTPIDLIVDGHPFTPALDRNQGAEVGMESTAQAVGGGDSFFGNLFMLPGEASEDDLFAAAAGGIFISRLDPVECFDPSHLQLRTYARGVRLIEKDGLGARLPDLVWEESLLSVLARLLAVGDQTVVQTTSSTPLGGISAPAVVLMESEGFSPCASGGDD